MLTKKLSVCCLGLVLAFSFAACGSGGKPAGTTAGTTTAATAPATTETTVPAPETTTRPQSETTAATTAEAAAESQPVGPAVPRDKAGVIAYFNAALERTPMRRASYRRTMTKITANAAFNIINEQNLQDDEGVKAIGNIYLTQSAPSDLAPLKAEWVKSAVAAVEGGTATLTITLGDYAVGSVADPVPGTLGYVGTVDKPSAERLVEDAAMVLAGGVLQRVSGVESEFGLSAGKYVVAVDTATGKIGSVRFTGTESATGKATCITKLIPLPVAATVTLRGDADAQYRPA
jgi:hypothetical protein